MCHCCQLIVHALSLPVMSQIVKRNLVSGVWMFIVSEAVLFFGLLWSCIHLGMAPTVHVQVRLFK